MKNTPTQTIIQQIQPQCDTLHLKMKERKDALHETNQSIADKTGIPISNIAKFFSGSLANPSVFYTAAICICLNISLDELLEIAPARETDHYEARIAELEAQLDRANSELELVKHHSKYLEDGIAERKRNYSSISKLCWFMIIPLVIYLCVDMFNSNFGFFTHEGVSAVGIAIIMAVVLSVGILVSHIVKEKKSNTIDKIDDEES